MKSEEECFFFHHARQDCVYLIEDGGLIDISALDCVEVCVWGCWGGELLPLIEILLHVFYL